MNWLFFALLSPMLYTCVQFVDKYIVEREVPDSRGIVILTGILSLSAGTLFWMIGGFPLLPFRDAALLLTVGVLNVLAAMLYFRAITIEATSNIIVFAQMVPIVVLIESFIILNERLAAIQLIGFALILIAAIGVSLKREQTTFRLSAAFFLMIGVAFFVASAQVLFKFVSADYAFTQTISYESWGGALGGLMLYLFVPVIRHAFHRNVVQMRRRGVIALLLNESLYVVAKLTGYMALTLGSATLVSVLSSTQVFIAILLGWLLTTLAPAIFREDVTRQGLLRKAALAGVLFAGLVLVS